MSKIDGAIKEMLGEKQRDYWCQMEEPRPSRRTGQDSEPDRAALEEGNPRARQQGRVGAGRDTRSWKSSHRAGQNPLLMAIHEPGQGQARDGHAARGRGLGLPSERKPPRGFRFPPLTHIYPLWPKPWAQ